MPSEEEHRERKRAYQRRYAAEHSEQARARSKAWRAANPEKVRLAKRVTPEAHERYKADQRRRYAANPDAYKTRTVEWKRKHPEKVRQFGLNYLATHREQNAEKARRRIARKANVETEPIDPLIVAERDAWTCYLCEQKVDRPDMSLDHVVPIVDGGTHTYSNVSLTHLVCNLRKGAGTIESYLTRWPRAEQEQAA